MEEFVKQPSLEVFHKCTKDNLTSIADHYSIIVSKTKTKKMIKHELSIALFEKGVLPDPGMALSPKKQAFPDQSIRRLELELELRRLELQDKTSEREAAARLREQEFRFKQMELEEQTKREIRLKELELNQAPPLRLARMCCRMTLMLIILRQSNNTPIALTLRKGFVSKNR